jgi:threonyl-tRNA synthetase
VAAGSGPKIGESGKFEGEFKCQQNPPYLQHRLDVWDKLVKRKQESLAKMAKKDITIELKDGTKKQGKAFETTPLDIAAGISKGLANDAVAAKIIYKEKVESLQQCVAADGESDDEAVTEGSETAVLWDMTRPLEGSCHLELLKFDDAEGQEVFWHSSAHILGQAMERAFGCHLTIGPALETGFYYDGFFGSKKISEKEDFPVIQKHAAEVVKEQQPFERLVITKEEALELFSENPFKVQLITNKVPDGSLTSCYRSGPLVDLCRGPHIQSTGKAKAFMLTKNSAAYWLGDQKLDSLQRVYGIAFPSDKQLKEYKKFLEEAEKRDHRNLGKQMSLFLHHPWASPGATFWFPAGARLYNKLIDFMKSEYRLRGFDEVITPNMFDSRTFKTSGHYKCYKDDMYSVMVESTEWMLKPMNCPGHMLMFDSGIHSYKDLPFRWADFGVLHRNEDSGALSGLTRVRRFQQDDAHIFLRPDQIQSEVMGALDFLQYVYGVFGFSATFKLSTRPKKAIGSKEIWDNAETQLKAALDRSGVPWSLNPGDGAFYGPKIDVQLHDVMRRKFQCGTIQLDFNGPIRWNLQYRKEGAAEEEKAVAEQDKAEFKGAEEVDEKGEVVWKEGKLKNGFERPVVVHRAILGSLERMSAILIEHYAGKWPFWLSPRQVMVVAVNEKANTYAKWVERQLTLHGFYAESDISGKTLPKKVREAQLSQWNFLAVVGPTDQQNLTVNLRERDAKEGMGEMSIQDLIAKLDSLGMPSSQQFRKFEPFEGRTPVVAATEPAQVSKAASTPASAQASKPTSSQASKKGASGKDDGPEAFLLNHPYLKGFKPTAADRELYGKLLETGFPETPNLKRWFDHMGSFKEMERNSWNEVA